MVSDFVREAIREKAARDLNALNQRVDAFWRDRALQGRAVHRFE